MSNIKYKVLNDKTPRKTFRAECTIKNCKWRVHKQDKNKVYLDGVNHLILTHGIMS